MQQRKVLLYLCEDGPCHTSALCALTPFDESPSRFRCPLDATIVAANGTRSTAVVPVSRTSIHFSGLLGSWEVGRAWGYGMVLWYYVVVVDVRFDTVGLKDVA